MNDEYTHYLLKPVASYDAKLRDRAHSLSVGASGLNQTVRAASLRSWVQPVKI